VSRQIPERLTPRHLFKVLHAVALLVFAGAPVRSLASQDAERLIEKYVAWRGGEAFGRIRIINERGSIEADGMHGAINRVMLSDGRYKQSARFPAYTQDDVVSLVGAWSTNYSGQVVNLSPAEARDDRRLAELAFATVLTDSARTKRQELAPQSRDGKLWSVLRITFGDPDTYDLFISPETAELHGIRVTQDLKTRFIEYSGWKLVAGVRMPFVEVVTNDTTGETSRVEFAHVEFDAPHSTASFNRPPDPKPLWRFSGGGKSTRWLSIDFFNQERIFIPAVVNGRNTEVLLDSGADASAIDRGFAASAGVTVKGTHVAVGSGGTEQSGFVGNLFIALGDLTVGPLTGANLDLASMGRRWGHAFQAILGREVFNDLIVDIDFPNSKIAFRDRQGFRAPAEAQRVVLGQYLAIFTIPVSIDGEPAVPAMFDLGNGGPLAIFPTYSGRQKLMESRPHSLMLGGGVGGSRPRVITTVRTLAVEDNVFRNVPAILPPVGNDIHNSNRVFANVGVAVFRRFRVICDLHSNLLYLVPMRKLIDEPFRKDLSGLQFAPGEKGWEVLFVAPGSPAAAQHLKPKDVIVAINGTPTGEVPASEVQAWRWGAIGTEITLKLADGSTVQFALREYY
jgi:hypothetical protein